MDVDAYLERIGYDGSREPTLDTLRALHRAHLLSVPFENLNIALGVPIVTDADALFHKIVAQRRGGFCYELNGLFASSLRALGFDVTLLSARVARADGTFGLEFDHLTLRVDLGEPYLADVGFGDSFREPLRLNEAGEQAQDGATFRIAHGDTEKVLERLEDGEWKPQYIFTLTPRRIADFDGMCHYHQTSPHSSFTERRVCTRATHDGRITLSDMKLVITRDGRKRERLLTSQAAYDRALKRHFGIVLNARTIQQPT